MEITQKLDMVNLVHAADTPDWLIEAFGLALLPDGEHYLNTNKLEILLHPCVNDLKSQNYEAIMPTAAQIVSLYDAYDEAVNKQFELFYEWLGLGTGNTAQVQYERGMAKANQLYKAQHGQPYYEAKSVYMVPAEEVFAFEEYIRENPDLEETNSAYSELLHWLGVIQ